MYLNFTTNNFAPTVLFQCAFFYYYQNSAPMVLITDENIYTIELSVFNCETIKI